MTSERPTKIMLCTDLVDDPSEITEADRARLKAEDWAFPENRLAAAIVDLCWKATQYGTTEGGDTLAYIVPKGTMHRLIGAAQTVGIPAAFRALAAPDGTETVQAERSLVDHWADTAFSEPARPGSAP